MVDKAPKFPDALEEFRTWMAKHGLDGKGTGNAKKFCYVTDGPWDIGKFLQMQCKKSRIAIPHDFRPFLNIRRAFVNFYCHSRRGHENQKKLTNIELKTMLAYLGMEFGI
jgi:3'-5' exoribonuclease 1